VRKFEFSLQTALDLRRQEEQAAQQRLAEAQRLAEGIRAHLRDTRARYREAIVALREDITAHGAAVELAQIGHSENYLTQLRQLIDLYKQRLNEATEVCEQRRQQVIAAARSRKTLERLRERREEEHRRTELRRESRLLDEIAVTSFSGHKDRALRGIHPAADRAA